MPWLWIALVASAVIVGLAAAAGAFVALQMRWMVAETRLDRYFGRTLEGRLALKAEMRRRARFVAPLLVVTSRIFRLQQPTLRYGDTTAPGMVCTEQSFRRATTYEPRPGDIFVATQMKCGTTWMQQIVYETLCRGAGDLSDTGLRHMYALSPWIESNGSVPLERAAEVGARRERIIKTHFATNLCPYNEKARYLYVTRHPFTCFASCIDFVRMLAGPFSPSYEQMLDWYCSDDMWWRSWPEHVDGWWRWAQQRENVLFIHYEHMLDDLDATVGQVAAFLDVDLTPAERAEVVRKSDYKYMKQHEEHFEMAPPSLVQADDGTSFFQSGKKDRDRALSDADRARIAAFCRERLMSSPYPLEQFYPDVARG